MTWETATFVPVNGAGLEFRARGAGEPVVFVHGGMPDECEAAVGQPALVERYRVIDYHRRGYGRSELPAEEVTIASQAADCAALLAHLGIDKAHFVGQSYGGVILLELSRTAPELMHSISLLEPALPSVLFEDAEFAEFYPKAVKLYEAGDKTGAVETFAVGVCGRDYRARFDRTLPSGYFDRWVGAADAMFAVDGPPLQSWSFTESDAARIARPVLNVVGAETAACFRTIHETVRRWLPEAERVEIPQATHGILQSNPELFAESLAEFLGRHPIER